MSNSPTDAADAGATQNRVAHVDLDAFFASCEQRDHPEYRGRPVVVGAMPGKRGVVAAASYEARVFGIHSAMPIAEAYRRCPDAVYLRPDIGRYRNVSRQIMRVLTTVTPVVEAASIDEAYLDVGGLDSLLGPPEVVGALIRERIQAATRLTASVGIGPNRLIAKLASESCKPDGLRIVAPGDVAEFLAPMPVGNLRGLGQRTLAVVTSLGIRTVGDLAAFPPDRLARHIGRNAAANFHRQAHGDASSEVVPGRQRKSISKETTFETDSEDRRHLHDTLRTLSAGVARAARAESRSGRRVTLKIRFRGFDTHTRQRRLGAATNDERMIFRTARELLDGGNLPQRPVRLIGVGLSDWQTADTPQPDLFAGQDQSTQDQRLLATLDQVTGRFGEAALSIGPRSPVRKD